MSPQSLIFAFFLLAGVFKGSPRLAWVPFDLTVTSGVLVILFCLREATRASFRVEHRIFLIALLFGCFAIGYPSGASEYGGEKILRLFTLTLLAACAPFFLVRSRDDFRGLFNALALLSLVHGIDAIVTLFTQEGLRRLLTAGSNTIALGKSAAIVLLALVINLTERRLGIWVGAFLALPAALVLVASGSRGPLLALAVALLVYWIIYARGRLLRALPYLLPVGGAGAVVLFFGGGLIPEDSLTRITTLFQGTLQTSERSRLDYFSAAAELIPQYPFGTGWGGFYEVVGLTSHGVIEKYPHNLILEVALEAGWLAGGVLLGLLVYALRRGKRDGVNLESRLCFSFFIFILFESMVSGDINDAKLMFAALSCVLGMQAWRQVSQERIDES